MKRRILRALQRGGVTAKRQGDVWAVWRCRDRRRRIIGTLPGVTIDLLRLYDCLVPFPSKLGQCLIWNVELTRSKSEATCHALITRDQVSADRRPVLDSLVLFCLDPVEREQLVSLLCALRRASARSDLLLERLSPADFAFLERLLVWPSSALAFSASEKLRTKVMQRRSVRIFKAILDGPY